MLGRPAIREHVAAVSCGIWRGTPLLDLDYDEDSTADTDANFVITGGGGLVEIQGSAEKAPFSELEFARSAPSRAQGHSRTDRTPETDSRMKRGQVVVVASHNVGKVRELSELLELLGLPAKGAEELGLPEPEETGATFGENAVLKARAAADATHLAALADDSGLVVSALDGAPGIYSARWAGPDKNFACAMARVERELQERGGQDLSAKFFCALALAEPDGDMAVFEGEVRGRLRFPPRGNNGFGYDPIFVADGMQESFGELDPALKHRISHRARAFEKLKRHLERAGALS